MKICPVCKEAAFDDAEVCYGCLCSFEGSQPDNSERPGGLQVSPPQQHAGQRELDGAQPRPFPNHAASDPIRVAPASGGCEMEKPPAFMGHGAPIVPTRALSKDTLPDPSKGPVPDRPVPIVLGQSAGARKAALRSASGRWRICLEIALVDDDAPSFESEAIGEDEIAYLMDVE